MFQAIDYVIFLSVPIISIIVTIVIAWRSKSESQSKVRSYFSSNASCGIFAVTLSMIANFQSAIFIVGVPAQIYTDGITYALIGVGYIPSVVFTAHFVIPKLYKSNYINTYEYFYQIYESRSVEIICSIYYVFYMIFYLGVVMYTPSVILQQASDLPYWASLLIVTTMCNIYTAIGGLKGVIWTDVLQLLFTFVGFIFILVVGLFKAGGIGNVLEFAKNGSKLDINVDASPFTPNTVYTLIIGGAFTTVTIYSANQEMIQRYLCLRSENKAKISLYLHMLGNWIFLIMALFIGLTTFKIFNGQDLVKDRIIANKNQILPHLIETIFADYPGANGLFITAIFSAALSSLSSGLNALSAVSYRLFISGIGRFVNDSPETLQNNLIYPRILTFGYGIIITCMSYLPAAISETVIELALTIFGASGGPVLGLLICALFFKFVKKKYALFGFVFGILSAVWIVVEYITLRNSEKKLSGTLSSFSYMYYGLITLSLTLVGIFSSLLFSKIVQKIKNRMPKIIKMPSSIL